MKRFWIKVLKTPTCWLWTGSKNKRDGRGSIGWERKLKLATHVAFFLKRGRWPKSNLLHSCDNPQCVRWSHLFEGDQIDNAIDMVKKGRNVNAAKKFCKRGHPLSGPTVRVVVRVRRGYSFKSRICRPCMADHMRRWRKARAEPIPGQHSGGY